MGLRFSDLCIDAADIHALASWWSEVLGWPAEPTDDGDVVLRAPEGAGPDWLFLAVPEGKVVKNRIHFDLTPDDQDAEVERVIALGARHVDIGQGDESWVVLADPEGNEFCILAAEE
ncbi:MAG: VOC family protein [Mycobacterium sp.]|nr:VOC family protein [Mycobacterium sp.]